MKNILSGLMNLTPTRFRSRYRKYLTTSPSNPIPGFIVDVFVYGGLGLWAVRSGFLELYSNQTTHTLWILWSIIKVVWGITIFWFGSWEAIELVSALLDLRRRKRPS
jgi:hypothetical protein